MENLLKAHEAGGMGFGAGGAMNAVMETPGLIAKGTPAAIGTAFVVAGTGLSTIAKVGNAILGKKATPNQTEQQISGINDVVKEAATPSESLASLHDQKISEVVVGSSSPKAVNHYFKQTDNLIAQLDTGITGLMDEAFEASNDVKPEGLENSAAIDVKIEEASQAYSDAFTTQDANKTKYAQRVLGEVSSANYAVDSKEVSAIIDTLGSHGSSAEVYEKLLEKGGDLRPETLAALESGKAYYESMAEHGTDEMQRVTSEAVSGFGPSKNKLSTAEYLVKVDNALSLGDTAKADKTIARLEAYSVTMSNKAKRFQEFIADPSVEPGGKLKLETGGTYNVNGATTILSSIEGQATANRNAVEFAKALRNNAKTNSDLTAENNTDVTSDNYRPDPKPAVTQRTHLVADKKGNFDRSGARTLKDGRVVNDPQ
ncbi:MAG: hypothetical protein KAG66_10700, partial [Methylococcales bacterium]|nr:hypothetical protein [Methylococcales bacterium]